MKKLSYIFISIPLLCSTSALAENDIKDMSDPLAVYTQVGTGITDKGINFKVGQAYDTGEENVAGMNVFEVKGIAGETLGWYDADPNRLTDSIDSIRYRNFEANIKNGRANQIDINYNLEQEFGTASYSFIQALPKYGRLSLYPLMGAGVAFANDKMEDGSAIDGYKIPGTFAVAGTYTKFDITDKIWLNYNPMWMTTISGSDAYKDEGIEGSDSVLTHEFAVSYQVSPRFNIRYFANWSEETHFSDGDHRLEFNYQI